MTHSSWNNDPPTSTSYQTSILLQPVMFSSPERTMPGDELSLYPSLSVSLTLFVLILSVYQQQGCVLRRRKFLPLPHQSAEKPLALRFTRLSMLFLKAEVYYHCELFTWFSDKLIFEQICWGVVLHDEPPLWNQKSKTGPPFYILNSCIITDTHTHIAD